MSEAKQGRERREVQYQGRVQGVGFRYTTRQIAQRFAVAGYVQNLPDGRVLLVAEGETNELDDFLSAVAAEMQRHLQHCDEVRLPGRGEFTSFEVRH